MAASACSYCGKPVPAGSTFCPSCGAAVPGAVPPPAAGGAAFAAFGAAPGTSVPTSKTAQSDLRALKLIQYATILALLLAVIDIAVSLSGGLLGLGGVDRSFTRTAVALPSPWYWVGALGTAAVVSILELLLVRGGFVELSAHDHRFTSPASLALVAVIGVVLASLGVGLLFDALYRAVACAGVGNPIPTGCLPGGEELAGFGLTGVGAIMAIVGYIGVLIGIWRLGTRYDETVFKVGAILLIFPLLNIVGAILLLVGIDSARKKVTAAGATYFPPGAAP